jgi:molecular chaperone GrpE
MDSANFLKERGIEPIIDDTNILKLLDEYSMEYNDKYIRLAADFENYKKRTSKEIKDAIDNTTIKLLGGIIEMDNDISIAIKSLDEKTQNSFRLISKKLSNFLQSYGVEEIDTTIYNSDLHEVISIIKQDEYDEDIIIDVVSKGYSINGKPFRYPKIILGKNNI